MAWPISLPPLSKKKKADLGGDVTPYTTAPSTTSLGGVTSPLMLTLFSNRWSSYFLFFSSIFLGFVTLHVEVKMDDIFIVQYAYTRSREIVLGCVWMEGLGASPISARIFLC